MDQLSVKAAEKRLHSREKAIKTNGNTETKINEYWVCVLGVHMNENAIENSDEKTSFHVWIDKCWVPPYVPGNDVKRVTR